MPGYIRPGPLNTLKYAEYAKKIIAQSFAVLRKVRIFAPQFSERHAEIAQSVEHFIRNERVAGSSPAIGSQHPRRTVPPIHGMQRIRTAR